MEWNASEMAAIAPIITAFDEDAGPRESGVRNEILALYSTASSTLSDGCPKARSQVIRGICSLMRFDESRLTNRRLEHKLVQALVLRAWCDAIPVTLGVTAALRSVDPRHAKEYLTTMYPARDVFIKRALGYGSGERKDADAREACLAALEAADDGPPQPVAPHDEVYILQDRLAIAREFRVHTVEGRVVPDLTWHRYSGAIAPSERDATNAFVQRVLDRLPNGLVRGVMAAWDVAETAEGTFMVVEINLTGYHLIHDPGFHCSGYFLGRWAAPAAAKLAAFLERHYGVTFHVDARGGETALSDALSRMERWLALHRIARAIDTVPRVRLRSHGADSPLASGSDAGHSVEERAFISMLGGLTHMSTTLRALT